jgi:hypothetical protein
MDLVRVSAALSRLNNNNPINDGGYCEPISVLTAEALVNGTEPVAGSAYETFASPGSSADSLQKRMILSVPPDSFRYGGGVPRGSLVWNWLQAKASKQPGKVYVFAQDSDHCYNFVVDGDIFLIDAATQLYRKVGTPGGASFYRNIPNYPYSPGFPTGGKKYPPSNTDFGFNYLNPQPKNLDDNLKIYDWGDIHPYWK